METTRKWGVAVNELLDVRDLTVAFQSKDKSKSLIPALDSVTFTIKRGETLGLVGESGCGKTLSSLAVMGLLPESARVQSGQLVFDGEDLLALKAAEHNKVRGVRIGMIFQDPMTSLSPYYTIGNQLMEGMRYHLAMTKRQAKERGIELLRRVGIPEPERVFTDYPAQLSGGMRQRVMIAIAISCEPDLLIADEPTTALDVTTQAQILELLGDLQREKGMSLVLISHDLGVIAEMCQRVVVMYAGQVIEQAESKALFASPTHPYTRALLAATPRLSSKQERFYSIPGSVPAPTEWGTGCRFRSRCEQATDTCGEMPPLSRMDGQRYVRCWYAPDLQSTLPKEVRA
ncbi:ABC transporter ATP-binding protein [Tumebacillus permanentifrigoris]|uniref:Peptide/nickel transport system ATP-binding protein n=1 Tax=Tumebacillus permanentifrigoris TaxID=378543 RepID=A0A316DA92_9BACL|nr:ABC transporter ATP-binding protein [Tumebacillus permanentifrigoris]PWK09582.1 peptide/nickel transport system ATP-binding protein [Tumebacillus permanentifrigoris]